MAGRELIPAETVDEVFKALAVLARTVDHVLQERAVENALGQPVSLSKIQVLRLLHRRGAQTPSGIARFLGVTRPSVSQLIESLEDMGWITRRSGVRDGREFLLELSEEGRERFLAVRRQQRHLLRSALRQAGSRGASAWIRTLREIAQSLAQADRAFDAFCLQCGAHADGTCVLVGGEADCPFLHPSTPRREGRRRLRPRDRA
ncbi:MAG: MarR family transcriptional regulator [Planctomycetota bacterium]|nr:MAG: MarR family transcriptional regulator [Planctomycetota bacterium]